MFAFDPEKFISTESLGSGPLGSVHPYRKDPGDNQWVIKRIFVEDTNSLLLRLNEVTIGYSCSHSGIIPLNGYAIEALEGQSANIYIKMPRMKENLNDYIKRNNDKGISNLPEEKIVKYFYNLVNALEYLHEKQIAHRDIKPTNVLFDEEDNIKLSDVSSAGFVIEEESIEPFNQQTTDVSYTAPEILLDSVQDNKELYAADIWSLGLILAEMCMFKCIGINPEKQNSKTVPKTILKQVRKSYSNNMVEILKQMLKIDPRERKTASEIRQILEEKYHSISENSSDKRPAETGDILLEDDNIPTKPVIPIIHKINIEGIEKRGKEIFQQFTWAPKVIFLNSQRGYAKSATEYAKSGTNSHRSIHKDGTDVTIKVTEDKRIWDLAMKALTKKWKKESFKILSRCLLQLDVIYDPWWEDLRESDLIELMEDIAEKKRFYEIPEFQEAYFGLRFCNHITEFGFRNFISLICDKLKVQSHLNIALGDCVQITDIGIQFIAANITEKLSNLKQLTLTIGNSQLTDEGVKYLTNKIVQHMKKLQQLRIDFYECKKVTFEAIIHLITSIGANSREIKILELSFERCFEMKKESHERLITTSNDYLAKLEAVRFNMRDSSSKKIHDGLRKKIAYNRNIAII